MAAMAGSSTAGSSTAAPAAMASQASRFIYAGAYGGALVAGGMELALFHPMDTVAKRLMNDSSSGDFKKIIFKDAAESNILAKGRALLPGLGYAAVYKLSQRVYKFGSQPIIKEQLRERVPENLKSNKLLMDGVSGMVVGMGEVALLPFDVLKIKMQTNSAALGDLTMKQVIQSEGWNLYKGWQWTMARNAPGSFALFGVNGLVKDKVFGIQEQRPTFFQHFVSSTAGGVASVLLVCPLDVIKTRVQSGLYGGKGMQIMQDIIREEGFGGFMKGSVPKVLMTAPKLIFSFTIAQWVADFFKS
jgi:hypothetical protein